MILVFGGTTEGRKAAEVLEEAGALYYYSTKTGEQELTLHHGRRTDGALDGEAMYAFCQEHGIRLIVDAAHPFALRLHETIAKVADRTGIPVVRYERIYPPRDADITWIDDYAEVPTDINTLLATTGVQSINRLKWLESKGVKVIYRILNRESSIRLAHEQGATDDQLCFYENQQNHGDSPHVIRFASHTGDSPRDSRESHADALLLKESGLSGGFVEKVNEARAKGMRIVALRRPQLPAPHSTYSVVNGPHGLRRAVEKLLPDFFPLHSGLTTGTCATAAAVAATIRLTTGEKPDEVPVLLPDGETIHVAVGYGDGYAYCVKESGDDPDVTDGIEVRAMVNHGDWNNDSSEARDQGSCPRDSYQPKVEILGGEGVGRFTLPGFDYPPGEAAINKGPREMLRKNILAALNHGDCPLCEKRSGLHGDCPHDSSPRDSQSWVCRLSVPGGADIARRTFNPRLGIEGGISIIGVSGIVKPFSEEAFIASIRKCVEVALASGTERIVINSGGKSERFVKALYPALPQQAFVEYGNYIGETLKIIASLIPHPSALSPQPSAISPLNVTLGVMLGKAVKLAQGHLDTHSKRATMDKDFISKMLHEAHSDIDISHITLARELWDLLPVDQRQPFAEVVIGHCLEHCRPLLPNGLLTILLIDDEGKVFSIKN